jgi:hypothetical protein
MNRDFIAADAPGSIEAIVSVVILSRKNGSSCDIDRPVDVLC